MVAFAPTLKILILHTGLNQADLFLQVLQNWAVQPVVFQASSEAEFREKISPEPDIILCFDSANGMDAVRVIQILSERRLEIPVIAVGEQIDEERAVECFRHGVAEFLYQDQFSRLEWVIQRVIKTRSAGKTGAVDEGSTQISAILRHVFQQRSDPRQILNTLLDSLEEAVFVLEPKTRTILECSAAVERVLGYSPAELIGGTIERFLGNPEKYNNYAQLMKSALDRDGIYSGEHWLKHKNGEFVRLDLTVTQICDRIGRRAGVVIWMHDVTERFHAYQAMKDRERQLEQIIQQMPLPIVIADVDGTLQIVNNAFLDMFGIIDDKKFIREFNPLTDSFVSAKQLTESVQRAKRGEVCFIPEVEINPSAEWKAQYGKGLPTRLFLDLTMFPVLHENGEVWRMVSIWNDVTRRKNAEQEMERRLDELKALQSIAMAAADATSLGELVERVSEIVGAKLYPDSFGIALIDKEKGLLNCHLVSRLPQDGPFFPARLDQGITGAVARSNKPRRVADVHADPDYLERYPAVRSELCVPITRGDRVIGVVDVEAVLLDAFSESDERLLVTVAGELGTAIEKIRLLEAEQHRNSELEALAQMSSAVRMAETRAEMLPAVLDLIMNILHTQGAAIAFRNPQNGALSFEITRGENQELQGYILPAGEGFGAQVIASLQYAMSLDMRSDPRIHRNNQMTDPRCLLCLPILAQGQPMGLLYLVRETVFDTSDIRLAQSMVDIFASAVYRVLLQEQTHQQLQRLTSLRMIDESILSSLDLGHTLQVLHDQTTHNLQVDAVDFLLYNPITETLYFTSEDGMSPVLSQEVLLKLGESHAGKVALERKMEYIPDLSVWHDDLTEKIEELDESYSCYLCIPLVSKGDLKGVLQIFNHLPLDLTPDWMSFLDALAGQAAIAIDNAQLFREQQLNNDRLVRAYDATLDGWSHALDLRDKETEGHSRRVTELTLILARELGVSESEMPQIRRGAQLHDIGKMGIPDSILLKPGPLTEEEWAIMRQHPIYAADLLFPIEFLQPALDIPYCHHEKWDGSGYPQGLKGEEIPLSARIFAVVDVWDALTSNRSYRPAWSSTQALKYIREQSGKHFDPQVVDRFMQLIGDYVGPQHAGNLDLHYLAMDD
jgi:PAS domain S-box-containing protein